MKLFEAQRDLMAQLKAGGGPPRASFVEPGASLEARFSVYVRSRQNRLEEVLRNDYPRVLALVGEQRFLALIRAYLEAYPVEDPALRNLGRHFPRFLEEGQAAPGLAVELARLEQLWVEVFDEEDVSFLSRSDLSAVPPPAWPGLRMRLIPALRLERFEHRVDLFKIDAPDETVSPSPTDLLIFRRDLRVFVRPLDPAEAEALSMARAGASFEEICSRVARAEEPVEAAAARAAGFLATWLDDRLVRDLCVPDRSA